MKKMAGTARKLTGATVNAKASDGAKALAMWSNQGLIRRAMPISGDTRTKPVALRRKMFRSLQPQ
jgi:hypothetical protein